MRELTDNGHEVVVQAGAGEGSTISDADYEAQGARILPDAEAVFAEGELILRSRSRSRARSRCSSRATRSSPTSTWRRRRS